MIQPETSREDIRELKRFNKTEPEAGVADDIHQLIEKFYHDNPEILNGFSIVPGYYLRCQRIPRDDISRSCRRLIARRQHGFDIFVQIHSSNRYASANLFQQWLLERISFIFKWNYKKTPIPYRCILYLITHNKSPVIKQNQTSFSFHFITGVLQPQLLYRSVSIFTQYFLAFLSSLTPQTVV